MADKKEINVSERPVSYGWGEPRTLTAEEREAREDAEMKLEGGAQPMAANDPHWKPGYLSRFPWLGMGSLAMVLICAIGCVITLLLSNGVSETRWPAEVAPNVIITILNSFANLCFGLAISNGIAIAWWRKTLQGSTIEQLNRSWLFSSSIKDVILGAKYFNFIALAALTAKLTIIDGTLLQKSFSTEIRPDAPVSLNLTGYANTTIPMTGRVSGRASDAGLLAKNWNDGLKIWAQGGGLLPNTYTGCDGLCFLNVPGAGFEFDCTEPTTVDINLGQQTVGALMITNSANCTLNGTYSTSERCQSALTNSSAELFHVNFAATYNHGDPSTYSYITMSMLYTDANDTGAEGQGSCPGKRYAQTCKLRPAVINYPVKIEHYKDSHVLTSISLAVDPHVEANTTFRDFNATAKQQNGFEVLRYQDVTEVHISALDDTRTRLGGVAQGLNMYLGGNATMTYGGPAGFYLYQDGNAPTYLFNDLGTQAGKANSAQLCGFQYNNPMSSQRFEDLSKFDPEHQYDVPNIVGKINQMMFALALDISDGDDDKDTVAGTLIRPATVYRDTIHYVINKKFMWGAFASIIFCILCVLPVYWGYWQLGRTVTLGPFEIAAAFRAPNLYHETNAPIDKLIKEVGDREVKFGAIVTGDDAGKIGVAEPEFVARIHPSAKTQLQQRLSTMRMSKHSTLAQSPRPDATP